MQDGIICDNEVTISLEKLSLSYSYFAERKRALRYILPRALYVGFTIRVVAKLRC